MSIAHTPFYNVQHSPIGSFASFTLGYPGAKGGFGLELGRPANDSLYIGVQSRDGTCFEALPFFAGTEDPSRRYDQNAAEKQRAVLLPFAPQAITRRLGLATDTWQAGDLEFRIITQYRSVPDPESSRSSSSSLKAALVPAVWAELTIDNREGKLPRRAFFGYQGSDPYANMRHFHGPGDMIGIGQGTATALASRDKGLKAYQAFTVDRILNPELEDEIPFGLGGVAALTAQIPAGQKKSFRFALCFYRNGTATSGLPSTYFYNRFFSSIEEVARYALAQSSSVFTQARLADLSLQKSKLSPEQQWQLAHAVHSYYGSTQLLDCQKKPFWVVNEGEYRMLNTFDLTADQVFFELELNPWTVRNELDWFVKRYSYVDKVRFPGQSKEFPGGISFTHDMGIGNVISRPHWSSYEKQGLHGCFSHMTHEELVNWILCALLYVHRSGDKLWLKKIFPSSSVA
ncbi:MAG: hypothetical protein HC904_15950 [Blastochloris sp.]|nr:hypothetical protein [Blastochloris sp.]